MKRFYLLFVLFFTTILFSQELIFNTQDFAPFSYLIDDKVSGPGVDIINAVCSKSSKIKPVYRLLPWPRAQQEVKEGKAHALFLIGKNKEREETLYFSQPILTTEYAIFINTSSTKSIKTIQDLKGLTIAVYGPSNTATTLEEIRSKIDGIVTDITPDDESAFKKLSNGRVDAVFSNIDVGNSFAKKLKIENVKSAFSYKQIKYYIGFSKAYVDKKTVDQFNASFIELYKDNTIQKILSSYNMKIAELE